MPWSQAQRQRLGFEKTLLESYFRDRVTWISPGDQTIVEVRATCTNDRQYTLRIYLPTDFPNSCPNMVVKASARLRARNGDLLECYPGDNHIGKTVEGYTGICHFRPNRWRNDNTLYQVTMKGLIWLEAYEAHLRTGRPLSQFLTDMPDR